MMRFNCFNSFHVSLAYCLIRRDCVVQAENDGKLAVCHSLRSPWWMSFLVALIIGLIGRFIAPEEYFVFSMTFTIPFVVIGFMVAWH